MLDLIDEAHEALLARHYRSALALTLIMPDICAQAECTDIYEKRAEGPDGKRGSAAAYKYWWDENIGCYMKGAKNCDIPHIDGEAAYQLRCNILHNGQSDISGIVHYKFELVAYGDASNGGNGQGLGNFRTFSIHTYKLSQTESVHDLKNQLSSDKGFFEIELSDDKGDILDDDEIIGAGAVIYVSGTPDKLVMNYTLKVGIENFCEQVWATCRGTYTRNPNNPAYAGGIIIDRTRLSDDELGYKHSFCFQ